MDFLHGAPSCPSSCPSSCPPPGPRNELSPAERVIDQVGTGREACSSWTLHTSLYTLHSYIAIGILGRDRPRRVGELLRRGGRQPVFVFVFVDAAGRRILDDSAGDMPETGQGAPPYSTPPHRCSSCMYIMCGMKLKCRLLDNTLRACVAQYSIGCLLRSRAG